MPCALRYPIPLRKQIKKIKSRDNPGKHSTLQATGVCGGGGRRVAGARQDYERCDCGLINKRVQIVGRRSLAPRSGLSRGSSDAQRRERESAAPPRPAPGDESAETIERETAGTVLV